MNTQYIFDHLIIVQVAHTNVANGLAVSITGNEADRVTFNLHPLCAINDKSHTITHYYAWVPATVPMTREMITSLNDGDLPREAIRGFMCRWHDHLCIDCTLPELTEVWRGVPVEAQAVFNSLGLSCIPADLNLPS